MLAALPATRVSAQPTESLRRFQNLTAEVSVGDHDGSPTFENVIAMTVDSRGRTYVWDDADYRIRVLDEQGVLRATLGRRGSGPGEFSQFGWMNLCQDSLWIIESSTARISRFAVGTWGARTTTMRVQSRSPSWPVSKLRSGFVVYTNATSAGRRGVSFAVADASGTLMYTLPAFRPDAQVLRFDIVQQNLRNPPVAGRQVIPQPLVASPFFGVSSACDGGVFVEPIVASADQKPVGIRISFIAQDGSVTWTRSTSVNALPISDAHYERIVDDLVAPTVVRNVRLVGSRRMIQDSLIRPKYWPAFTSVVPGIDGSIWVRRGGPKDANGELFWQFTARGELAAEIRTPPRFRVFAASSDRVWGVQTDADGSNPVVQRLRVR